MFSWIFFKDKCRQTTVGPQLNTVLNVYREKRNVICLAVYFLCSTPWDDRVIRLLKSLVRQQTVQEQYSAMHFYNVLNLNSTEHPFTMPNTFILPDFTCVI